MWIPSLICFMNYVIGLIHTDFSHTDMCTLIMLGLSWNYFFWNHCGLKNMVYVQIMVKAKLEPSAIVTGWCTLYVDKWNKRPIKLLHCCCQRACISFYLSRKQMLLFLSNVPFVYSDISILMLNVFLHFSF